jgi:hypothetical protein
MLTTDMLMKLPRFTSALIVNNRAPTTVELLDPLLVVVFGEG